MATLPSLREFLDEHSDLLDGQRRRLACRRPASDVRRAWEAIRDPVIQAGLVLVAVTT